MSQAGGWSTLSQPGYRVIGAAPGFATSASFGSSAGVRTPGSASSSFGSVSIAPGSAASSSSAQWTSVAAGGKLELRPVPGPAVDRQQSIGSSSSAQPGHSLSRQPRYTQAQWQSSEGAMQQVSPASQSYPSQMPAARATASRPEHSSAWQDQFSLRRERRVPEVRQLEPVSEQFESTPPAPSKSSASSSCRSALKQKQASAEPSLLILRATYLSGLTGPGWFERPTNYLLSVHVGDEARGDPPKKPGKHCTHSVPAAIPRMVAPEEMELRQRIETAVTELMNAAGGGLAGGHECRFNSWITVRLADCGPGPASGGPAYFRVDVWVDKTSLFGQAEQSLFGRVFVPLHNPEWQRRPCTWPVVNEAGKDLAYLTCEFAFAHAPDAVRHLQVDSSTSSQVSLSWRPPRVRDEAVPILGYQVEALALHRGQHPVSEADAGGRTGKVGSPSKDSGSWQMIEEVEVSAEPGCIASNLKRDMRYRFRICAVNQAGVGDATEVEAVTGPGPPGMCGPPRLAGCSQCVLTIEWAPPIDNGGMPIVGYWLWVRPYSSMCAVDSTPDGHVKHVEGESAQRADVHTDELNPSVGRYLCSVAAINAAEEVGPPTPDVNSLPFPNPCAVCGPSPQALAVFPDMQRLHDAHIPSSQPSVYTSTPSNDYGAQGARMQDVWEPAQNGRRPGRASQQMSEQFDYHDDSPPPPPPRPDNPCIGPYGSPYGMPDYDDAPVQRSAPAHASAMGESPDHADFAQQPAWGVRMAAGNGDDNAVPPEMPTNFTPLNSDRQQGVAAGRPSVAADWDYQEVEEARPPEEAGQHVEFGRPSQPPVPLGFHAAPLGETRVVNALGLSLAKAAPIESVDLGEEGHRFANACQWAPGKELVGGLPSERRTGMSHMPSTSSHMVQPRAAGTAVQQGNGVGLAASYPVATDFHAS